MKIAICDDEPIYIETNFPFIIRNGLVNMVLKCRSSRMIMATI